MNTFTSLQHIDRCNDDDFQRTYCSRVMKALVSRQFTVLSLFSVLVIGIASWSIADVTSGKVTKWFEGIPEGVFIEGPVFDRDNNLWVVEINSGYISRVTKDKTYERVINLGYQSGPNGMKFNRDGNLIICHRQRGIVELNPQTKEIKTICTEYEGAKFNFPNDLVLDSKGWAYFTDPGAKGLGPATGVHNPTGDVYRVNLKTGLVMKIMDNLLFPNGIQLSEDETTLYIGECAADRVVQAILNEDGSIGWWASYWARMNNPGGGGPDGMCYDVVGNLYAAIWDGGGVAVLDPRGTQIEFIEVPKGYGTTYPIFGGPDNKMLYILESNNNVIWRVQCKHAGRPLYHETWKH